MKKEHEKNNSEKRISIFWENLTRIISEKRMTVEDLADMCAVSVVEIEQQQYVDVDLPETEEPAIPPSLLTPMLKKLHVTKSEMVDRYNNPLKISA